MNESGCEFMVCGMRFDVGMMDGSLAAAASLQPHNRNRQGLYAKRFGSTARYFVVCM